MTYQEHVEEAERLLGLGNAETPVMARAVWVAMAQAHATLALAVRRGSELQEPPWYTA